MQIDLSMTIGDVIVAGATVSAIITCYYALKNLIRNVLKVAMELKGEVEELAKRVDEHDEEIASIKSRVGLPKNRRGR